MYMAGVMVQDKVFCEHVVNRREVEDLETVLGKERLMVWTCGESGGRYSDCSVTNCNIEEIILS